MRRTNIRSPRESQIETVRQPGMRGLELLDLYDEKLLIFEGSPERLRGGTKEQSEQDREELIEKANKLRKRLKAMREYYLN